MTLGKDRFVALRCGIGGGELMTEPIEVIGPRLGVNATCLFGHLQVRVIADASVPEGFDFESCNGLSRGDETDCEITWGQERRDLTPFVGQEYPFALSRRQRYELVRLSNRGQLSRLTRMRRKAKYTTVIQWTLGMGGLRCFDSALLRSA